MSKSKEEKIREMIRKHDEERERREKEIEKTWRPREKAAQYLKHVRGLDARVKTLQAEIERARETMDGLKSVSSFGGVSSGSIYTDAIPDLIIRLEELIRAYCTDLAYYLDAHREACGLLKRMPEKDQASVLIRRYLMGETTRGVANALNYSFEEVLALDRAGLDSLYDLMPQYWRDKEVVYGADFEIIRRGWRDDSLALF